MDLCSNCSGRNEKLTFFFFFFFFKPTCPIRLSTVSFTIYFLYTRPDLKKGTVYHSLLSLLRHITTCPRSSDHWEFWDGQLFLHDRPQLWLVVAVVVMEGSWGLRRDMRTTQRFVISSLSLLHNSKCDIRSSKRTNRASYESTQRAQPNTRTGTRNLLLMLRPLYAPPLLLSCRRWK